MNIAAGMAGLKAAAELMKSLREGLKSGQINGDIVAGRIGEIYDYIVDSKDALVEAKDEIQSLKQKVSELEAELNRRLTMTFANGAYWTRDDGPFCQLCWEAEKKPIRLLGILGVNKKDSDELIYTCAFHPDVRTALPQSLKAFRERLVAEGQI